MKLMIATLAFAFALTPKFLVGVAVLTARDVVEAMWSPTRLWTVHK